MSGKTTDANSYSRASPPLVIGVDLGGTQMRVAILRGATLLSRIVCRTSEHPGPAQMIPAMLEAIEQALIEANVALGEIAGIGVGAPGPLERRSGVVVCPSNLPGWRNVPLRALLAAALLMPVYVENDANAATLGEYLFGAGRGYQDLVYLTIGTGIGGGIITNGQLLTGSLGMAGELGHMTIDWHGPPCACGNRGCLESLASGTAIARRAIEQVTLGHADGRELLAYVQAQQRMQGAGDLSRNTAQAVTPSSQINARTVAEAAKAGVPLACEILADAAEALGCGLVTIIHVFNPQIIILGGSVVQIGEPLLSEARRIVNERAISALRKEVPIVPATFGTDAGLVGARCTCLCSSRAIVRRWC